MLQHERKGIDVCYGNQRDLTHGNIPSAPCWSLLLVCVFLFSIGRKKMFMVSVILHIVSTISIAFVPSFPILGLLYCISGMSGIAIWGNAYVVGRKLRSKQPGTKLLLLSVPGVPSHDATITWHVIWNVVECVVDQHSLTHSMHSVTGVGDVWFRWRGLLL